MDGEKQDLSREEDIYTVPLTKVIIINHHYNTPQLKKTLVNKTMNFYNKNTDFTVFYLTQILKNIGINNILFLSIVNK